MICRTWKAWTSPENAAPFAQYLEQDLFPKAQQRLGAHGYRGYQLLRATKDREVEFMTLVWFDSFDAVRDFAGDFYEIPTVTGPARHLLAHYSQRCTHYELSATSLSA